MVQADEVPVESDGAGTLSLDDAVATFIRCVRNGYFGKRGLRCSPVFLAMQKAHEEHVRSQGGAVPEAMLVAAYKRGFEWCIENGPDRDYINKAALDYADATLSAQTHVSRSTPEGYTHTPDGLANQIRGLSIFAQAELDNGDTDNAKKTLARITDVANAAIWKLSAAPQTPQGGAVPDLVERVCHNDQLVIWGEEFLCALECWIAAPETYDDGVQLAQAAKAEIKRIVTTAFQLAQPPEGGTGWRDAGKKRDSDLRDLASVWELDGDLMRCRECGRALIASRDGETLHHHAECKHRDRGHPWAELRNEMSVTSAPPVQDDRPNAGSDVDGSLNKALPRQDVEGAAFEQAKRLAIALHAKHYSDNTRWRADEDLLGIILQIDNMTSVLVKPEIVSAERSRVIEAERARCAEIVRRHQIAFASDACGWALDKILDGLPPDAIRDLGKQTGGE